MADIITYWGNDNQTEPCLPGFEYESYNDSLTITSEADLLTPNAYGQPVYDPFTEEDYGNIETRIKRLGQDLAKAIADIRWTVDKELPDGTRLYFIIRNLNHQMVLFANYVRRCHRKLVRTIYAEHISDTGELYDDHLRKPIEEYKRIISNIKPSICNYHIDKRIYDGADQRVSHYYTVKWCEDHHLPLTDFRELLSVYIDEDLMSSFNDTLTLADAVYTVLTEIRLSRFSRSNAELVIIFDYLQKTYYQQLLDQRTDKAHYPYYRRHKGFFSQSCMKMDSTGLRALQSDIKQRYIEKEIVKLWYDNCYDDLSDEEKENLIYQIVRINPTEDDYHKLFDYLIESENVHEQLMKRVDYESKGDPMFSVWVDAEKLQEELDPWIRANIRTKGKWFVVWCLMKHTHSMLREDVDMQQFAERMNQMFDCEKPCDYESIRKFHNKLNHNKPFSEWISNDPDYDLASSLNSKLAKKDKFKRISDIAFQ